MIQYDKKNLQAPSITQNQQSSNSITHNKEFLQNLYANNNDSIASPNQSIINNSNY